MSERARLTQTVLDGQVCASAVWARGGTNVRLRARAGRQKRTCGADCHDGRMRAAVRSIWLDPHPSTLSADPDDFAFTARMVVGPDDAPGEESLT